MCAHSPKHRDPQRLSNQLDNLSDLPLGTPAPNQDACQGARMVGIDALLLQPEDRRPCLCLLNSCLQDSWKACTTLLQCPYNAQAPSELVPLDSIPVLEAADSSLSIRSCTPFLLFGILPGALSMFGGLQEGLDLLTGLLQGDPRATKLSAFIVTLITKVRDPCLEPPDNLLLLGQ